MHADLEERPRRGRATTVWQFLLAAALLAMRFAQAESPSQLGRVSAQVVAGRYFSCALDTDGAVQCWGTNDHGQLGAAASAQSAQPSTIGLSIPAVSIAVGRSHACALLSDGSVACWGANDQGQLGDGSTTDRSAPVAVVGLTRRVAGIFTGAQHTCALDTSGGVWCWGANEWGQLGPIHVTPHDAVPQRVFDLGHALGLATGDNHTCAVLVDGSLSCWGSNESGQLGVDLGYPVIRSSWPQAVSGMGEAVVGVSAGAAHTCALGASGRVYCWGHNANGQVGDGSLVDRALPQAVTGGNLGQHRAVALSAGFAHTCAVLDSDEIDCWGDNDDGQLGDGSTTERLWPTPAAAGPFIAGANVSAGYSHTCAKTPTGGALCWGSNGYGELAHSGADADRPVAIGGRASGVLSVAASYAHFCALAADGGVSCWGQNFSGELGNGSLRTGAHVPQPVLGLSGPALQVAAGQQHTCAAMRDGTVQCWGRNAAGQLGDGTLATRPTPADVVGLAGAAIAVATGDEFACALLQNGQVMCWGANDSGELGSGDTNDSPVPVRVLGLQSPAIGLAAGAMHACALLADQSVACWGDNSETQLGSGSGPNRAQASPVVGLAGPVHASASAIAASEVATCVVLDDGGVQCWGFDQDRGTLGQGTLTNSTSPPARVVGLAGRVGVFAGQYHFCAVGSAGDAACWGQGGNGQLGTGQKSDSGTPAAVIGLDRGAVAMAGSYSNTCAVRDSGALFCWGDGSNGMLGLGDSVPGIQVTPASVRLGQRIAFASPGAMKLGDPPLTLSAVASSAADVTFDTWTPDTCTISGNSVLALAPAVCGIRATQAGNGVFAPAPPVYVLVPVNGVPKFTVTKTSNVAAAQVGQSFIYAIRVTNEGSDVGSASLSDTFPSIVESDLTSRMDCKTTGDGAFCEFAVQSPPFSLAGATVTLPPGGTALLEIPVTALGTGDANNTVTLTPTSPVCQSQDCGGGSASTGPIPVGNSPLFTQTKAIDSAAHLIGDSVVYTILIWNEGGDGNAQWHDDLPPQLTLLDFQCAVPAGAQCDAAGSSGNALQGSVSLPHASSATITLTARANASGDITNTVRVTPTTASCASSYGGANPCGGGAASTVAAHVYSARLSLQADFGGAGRLSPSDQFLLTLGGSNGDSVVTAGPGGAIVSRAASALGDAGAQFTLGEAMAAGSASTLESYAPQLACANALSPAAGGTDPSTLQLNGVVTLRDGDDIGCLVHNAGARATLTLHQQLMPVSDPGRFILSANNTNSAALGDGGTLGPLTLDAGSYTLAAAAASGTILSQYDVGYRCVDALTRASVSSGSGASFVLALGSAQHLDCTFAAKFAHSRLLGALGGQRQYAQFGHVLTYLVEIANTGGVAAAGAHVASALGPAFDPARTSFVCVATPPAVCLAQGNGVLSDTPSLPPGGRVSYVVSAGLLATPTADAVHTSFAFGATSDIAATQNLAADTQLVIFRDGLEPGGDGSQWDTAADAMPASLSADGPALDLSPFLRRLQRGVATDIAHGVAGDTGVRIEAMRLDTCIVLRLLTQTGDGTEVPSAWLRVDADNPIALLARTDGGSLLTGADGATVETVLGGDAPLQLQVPQ